MPSGPKSSHSSAHSGEDRLALFVPIQPPTRKPVSCGLPSHMLRGTKNSAAPATCRP